MAAKDQSSTFISDLAAVIYTPQNIERANAYLPQVRKINPAQLRFPWVYTGPETQPFNYFRNAYPPVIFTDSLYIPVPDIGDPTGRTLAGFDVRYLGPAQNRLRYHKFRTTPDAPLFYNIHGVLNADDIVVTEGAIDAEAIRACQLPGVEAFGALTALANAKFAYFLLALGKRIWMAYDNDEDGRSATQSIMEVVSCDPRFVGRVTPLVYPGKDPGKALEAFGLDMLKQRLSAQIC